MAAALFVDADAKEEVEEVGEGELVADTWQGTCGIFGALRPTELGASGTAGTPIFCAAAKYAATRAAAMAAREWEEMEHGPQATNRATADNLEIRLSRWGPSKARSDTAPYRPTRERGAARAPAQSKRAQTF